MNKNIVVGIIIVVALLIAGGLIINNRNKTRLASEQESGAMMANEQTNTNQAMTDTDHGIQQTNATMQNNATSPSAGLVNTSAKATHGDYKDYSSTTVAAEQKAGHKVVLFFHATWCPECRAADAAFKANPGSIPTGVTVLKTDYDSNKDLKTKYGVTYQHTFVQIDANGNMITKWNSGDIAQLKANIQ